MQHTVFKTSLKRYACIPSRKSLIPPLKATGIQTPCSSGKMFTCHTGKSVGDHLMHFASYI